MSLNKEEIFKYYELIFDEEVSEKSMAEFQRNRIMPEATELLNVWIQRNCEDLSLYNDPRYLKELVFSYLFASKYSIAHTFNYFKEIGVDARDLVIFEDYPGIGLTTMDLLKRGCENIFIRPASLEQDAALQKMVEYNQAWEVAPLRIPELKSGHKFDIVFSLETIEHFQDFEEYLKDITNLVNDNGYFILAKCFSSKNMYTGHFKQYYYSGKAVTHLQASKIINSYLRDNGFVLLSKGYNQKPLIYQKQVK